ncbi:MAG TPA: hypothetical protein VFU89_08820 [Rhabdochlamydiaceae bacterium]|nr:hypothetical protein [Rhabdochlamydiaceae bacterium]
MRVKLSSGPGRSLKSDEKDEAGDGDLDISSQQASKKGINPEKWKDPHALETLTSISQASDALDRKKNEMKAQQLMEELVIANLKGFLILTLSSNVHLF